MNDLTLVGKRVELLLPLPSMEAGLHGTIVEIVGRLGVQFDGHEGVTIRYQSRDILDFCEIIPDERPMQLTFDWWLNWGDWSGQRGEQDD